MQFSDTTNKNGLVQAFEFWTRQPDGTVTGTALKQATARINAAFDNIMPLLLAYNDQLRWDDINNTTTPTAYDDIVSGTSRYKNTADAGSLDILNLVKVRILASSTASDYTELERMTMDDERVAAAISPGSADTGIPTHFLEQGNVMYLYPSPNYSATNGIELFFGRQQSYFASTDTTKEPGIPLPFHELLVWHAALDWNVVNRTEDATLIAELRARIANKEKELKHFIDSRNPTRVRMTMRPVSGK